MLLFGLTLTVSYSRRPDPKISYSVKDLFSLANQVRQTCEPSGKAEQWGAL